jgi:hypothetical protein
MTACCATSASPCDEISGIARKAVQYRAWTGQRATLKTIAPSLRPTQVLHL